MAPEDNYDNVTLPGNPGLATISDLLEDYDDYLHDNSTDQGGLVTPCFDGDDDSTLAGWQTVFYILVFLLGIMGNSMVVATFACYWRTRLRSLTDAFLLHLALSDLQLLLTLPLQAWEALCGEWPFSSALCKLTKGLWSVNTYSGLLLLACISGERYSVVVHRSGASRRGKNSGGYCHRPMRQQAVAACLSVALAAVALSVPDFLFSEVEPNSGMCGINVWVEGAAPHVKMMLSGSMIAGFCVPFAVMATCYTAIGLVLAQGHKQAHSRGHGQSWRRQRTLRLMVALVLLFLLFQLPYTLVLGLKLAVSWRSCALLLWESGTRSLAYTRCCLNPILYALVGMRFRNDVLRLLRDVGCLCLSPLLTPDPDSGSSVSPPPTMSMQLSPKSPTPLLTPLNIATPTCQRKVFVYPPLSSHHT